MYMVIVFIFRDSIYKYPAHLGLYVTINMHAMVQTDYAVLLYFLLVIKLCNYLCFITSILFILNTLKLHGQPTEIPSLGYSIN